MMRKVGFDMWNHRDFVNQMKCARQGVDPIDIEEPTDDEIDDMEATFRDILDEEKRDFSRRYLR